MEVVRAARADAEHQLEVARDNFSNLSSSYTMMMHRAKSREQELLQQISVHQSNQVSQQRSQQAIDVQIHEAEMRELGRQRSALRRQIQELKVQHDQTMKKLKKQLKPLLTRSGAFEKSPIVRVTHLLLNNATGTFFCDYCGQSTSNAKHEGANYAITRA